MTFKSAEDVGAHISYLRKELQHVEAENARLREALEKIVSHAKPPGWLGDNPDYGDGYDTATEGAAEVARKALEVKP
jgi:hypothetical protein